MTCRTGWWCLLALAAAPGVVAAQDGPGQLIVLGVQAYQDLEFNTAVRLFQRALEHAPASELPAPDRARALAYLGAADVFRGGRDSATAAFRRIVLLDPRYRLDPLIFPPEVTTVFERVVRGTKVVTIEVAQDQDVEIGKGVFRAHLIASSFHAVEATLRYPNSGLFRTLYDGPIGDSLDLRWDGRDAAAQPAEAPRLVLRVMSRSPAGRVVRIIDLPLDVRVSPPDTLNWPPAPAPSLFLPERASGGPARRALLGGVLFSGAVVALPSVVSGQPGASHGRLAVAAGIGLAGIVGYVVSRPGRPLAVNVRANQALRADWQSRLADVQAENARRRATVHLVIHTGAATTIVVEGP